MVCPQFAPVGEANMGKSVMVLLNVVCLLGEGYKRLFSHNSFFYSGLHFTMITCYYYYG